MAKEGDPPVSMNAKNIESAIYGAASHTLGLENRKKLDGLTRDMAAAIYLYTMDTNFYKIINALLRDDERDPLKPFFPYLKLVMTGLRRLEKQETEVYRGVALPLSLLDGAEHYIPGNVVVWWPFSSSSVSRDVLADPLFLGTSGKRTLFTIKVSTARDIRAYSWKAKENELLILPGTPFKVASVDTVGDLTTIHLEEDVDAPDMIDSGDDTYEMVDFKDAQEGFYDLAGDAYDAIEDDSGGGGAADAYDLVADAYDVIEDCSGGGGAADAYDLVADQSVGVDSTQDLETTASWYVGSMKQSECDSIVSQAGAGCFLVRESSQDNKNVLSVNYQGKAKNFQIVVKKEVGANGKPTTIYVFSGKNHASLELLVDYSVRHSVHKSGEKIPLTESAISAGGGLLSPAAKKSALSGADQRVGVNPDAPCLPSKFRPWDYRGKSRKEWTDHLLANNVPGYFVLRDTDKAFCALTIVIKDKDFKHTHWSQFILQNAQGEFKLKGAKLRFSTIPAMIAAYRDPKTFEKQKKKDVPFPLQGHLAGGGGGTGSCLNPEHEAAPPIPQRPAEPPDVPEGVITDDGGLEL